MDSYKEFENIIIGAGPAGLQMAYYLQKRQQNYLILERSDKAGSFFRKFPRHRKLLSINKKYTGYKIRETQLRYDWNSLLDEDGVLRVSDYSDDYFPDADVIVAYCNDYIKKHKLKVEFSRTVENINKIDDRFIITISDGTVYKCARLFVGTGVTKENIPDIKGLELCQTYATAPIKAEDYKNKRVLIIGKGNSAFETADNLIKTTQKIQICSPKHVKLAWKTHYVGDLRAVNNNFVDTYLLKSQNNILEGELTEVRQEKEELIATIYFASRKRSYDFYCDNVILCTGFKFDDSIYDDSCKPEITPCGRLPKMTSSWQSTTVSNMYFIGTLMQMRDYRKTMSGFIHGFRHNIKALDQILMSNTKCKWEDFCILPYDCEKIVNHTLFRISHSAGLFLQPGFLCDLFWLNSNTEEILYWHDVPRDYAIDKNIIDNAFMVSLEYQQCDANTDPLAMPRGIGVEEDFYLHPMIRQFRKGKVINRYFLMDDLDNDWLILTEHRAKMCIIFDKIFSSDISDIQDSVTLYGDCGRTDKSAEKIL